MTSAVPALAAIDRAIEEAEDRFTAASQALSSLEQQHEGMLGEELALIDELARVYLDDLSPRSISGSLDALRDQLATLLRRQESHGAGLEARIQDKRREFVDAFGAVRALDQERESLESALSARRGAVDERLRTEPGYLPMREEHDAAMEKLERVRARRGEIMALARQELPRYGKSLEFRYLMSRRFGQPDQRGWAATRLLDGWIARRVDFPTMLRNYEILDEGPTELRAEIDRLTERAEELEGELDRMEGQAAEEEGLVVALEGLEELEARRREAEDRKESARRDYEADTKELRQLETARGSHYEEAIRLHQTFLESKEMSELWKIAESTPEPRDDHLVGRLEEHRRAIHAKEQEISAHVDDMRRREDEIEVLIAIRDEAHRRFGHRRSRFHPGMELARELGRLSSGEIEPKAVLDHIERYHYQESFGASPMSLVEGLVAELSTAFDLDGRPALDPVRVLETPDGERNTYSVTVRDKSGTRSYKRVTRRSPYRTDG